MSAPVTPAVPVPIAAAPQPPLPIAIADLLARLAEAWTLWQSGPPAATVTGYEGSDDDPEGDAEIVKARRAGRGVDDARWNSMLTRVGPAKAMQIKAEVVREALGLVHTAHIAVDDAVTIVKGLVVASQPRKR